MRAQFIDEEGWDQIDEEGRVESESQQLFIRTLNEGGLSLLSSLDHSLMPDMLFGWRPKLPSCPLPLSFANPYVDSLLEYIPTDDRYRLAYLGARPANSVQINHQYSYFWRYRNRYNSIKNSKKDIGGRQTVQECEYRFESQFESGNLDVVIRVKPNQYDCFLRSDTNTKGHTSWYYFSVENGARLGEIQLNICNFGKARNLYNSGMKPFVLEKDIWSQEPCYEVMFTQKHSRYGFDVLTNELQFKYHFTAPYQKVYLAYAVPYTYTQLEQFVRNITQEHPKLILSSKLCQSLGGVSLPLLTISQHRLGSENEHANLEGSQQPKRAILITARIHPGESNASYLMQGFIRQLLSDSAEYECFRRQFVCYIVPMLNPDGVIAGNFRTSYSGKDLNRQFGVLNKFVYPQITYLHELAVNIKRTFANGFEYYFDFHGHSSKKGLFCYGPEHLAGNSNFFKARIIAKTIEQINPIFLYNKSIFTISASKKYTARAHMLWKLKIPMTFTFEVSNGIYCAKEIVQGASLLQDKLMGAEILKEAGMAIAKGLFKTARADLRFSTGVKAKIDTRMSHGHIKTEKGNKSYKPKTKTMKEISLRQLKSKGHIENSVYKSSERLEMMRIIEEIKTEANENGQAEGGSDSQSEAEDLCKEELKDLHRLIASREAPYKDEKMMKLLKKNKRDRVSIIKRTEKEKMTQSVEQMEKKKDVSSKYMEGKKKFNLTAKAVRRPQAGFEREKVVVPVRNFFVGF